MKQILVVLIALLALAPAVAGMGDTSPGIDDGADYQLLNPGFIPNVGQYDLGVGYVLQHREATVFFTRDGLVLTHTSGDVIRQSFAGASPDVNLTAGDQRPGTVNYYVGNGSSKWLSDIPVYSGIVYGDLYPGIDLVYTGEDGRLKREFHVSAGADPSQIELVYEGERAPHVDDDGVLRFASPAGEMLESPLVCWQVIDDERINRAAEYVVDCGSVRIAVAEYDAGHELIIDPELIYSSYLGGNRSDDGYALVPDGSGGVWVTGYTWSADFPTSGAHSCSYGGSCDVFISHFSSDGDLLSSTYLGGDGDDLGRALVPDGSGGVWVMGSTTSTNFPTKNACQGSYGGYYDAFVSHFSSDGALLSSTYLGGRGTDHGHALASDGDGGVWVTGSTSTTNFPTKNACQGSYGGYYDAFVTHFSSDGDLLSSTYLGGGDSDDGTALVPDGSGGVWVMGSTTSTNFPTKNACQGSYGGGGSVGDAFVAHFSSDGDLLSSTYLGGADVDVGSALESDGAGGVWVTGYTGSYFPVKNAYQSNYGGGYYDAFVSHFSSDGALLSSTYLGGTRYDHGYALASDDDGGVWVTGYTSSPNFPVKNAYQRSHGGADDAFVAHFSSDGALLSSTYLGGDGDDLGRALVPDGSGGVWAMGITESTNFPTKNACQGSHGGGYDAFVSHFLSDGDLLSSTYLGGSSVDLGRALVPDGSGGVWVVGSTTSTNFPTKDAYQSNYGGGYSEDLFIARFDTDDPVPILPPVADFTVNVTSGVAPLTVWFTDTSTDDPTSWDWSFGDGMTSTEQNPAHTYESAGTYTVTLTATNDGGSNTETRIDYITVTPPPPAAGFTADPTGGNAPLTVQFTDESTGDVTARVWDFGDGNFSTVQNPAHTYESAGNYTVSLNASNAYGYSVSSPATITVLNPPAATFTANVTEGNAPLPVLFTDESTGNVTSWAWDFGDGNTSTVQNPSHTYGSAGTYNVTLNASNAYGYSVSSPTTITVLEPPAANFTVNVTGGNAPLTVQFTDESAGNVTSWLWDLGDGNFSTVHNPSHTYESAGTYNVTLNASNAYGYSVSSPTTITVLESPVADFTADPTKGNAPLPVLFTDESTGNVTSWAWDFGDGNTSTEQNPTHTYKSAGIYTVNLTVNTQTDPVTLSRSDYITVTPPRGDVTGNGIVDISDVAKVAYMVVGKEPADLAADFNGNERVDIGDAAKIAYFVVGEIDTL